MTLQVDVPHATKEELFSLMTDYHRYPEWSPDVAEASVLAHEGDIVVAEFLSPELMTEKYQLEFVHSEPQLVQYRQMGIYHESSAYDQGLSGKWRLDDAPDGQGTIVTGEMQLHTGMWQRFSNQKKIRLVLQRRLEVLQLRFAGVPQADDAVNVMQAFGMSSHIIQALQSGEECVVWLSGNRYVIRRADNSV